MKKIPLTQGKFALVDDEDFDELSSYNWHIVQSRKNNTWYATRNLCFGKKQKMHRQIINAPDNKMVDHINGDGLDNRKINLRICTHRQNMGNAKLSSKNSSGYKGVSWHKKNKKWIAQIGSGKHRKHLGLFSDKKNATRAYNEMAIKYYGEFAKLNDVEEIK